MGLWNYGNWKWLIEKKVETNLGKVPEKPKILKNNETDLKSKSWMLLKVIGPEELKDKAHRRDLWALDWRVANNKYPRIMCNSQIFYT